MLRFFRQYCPGLLFLLLLLVSGGLKWMEKQFKRLTRTVKKQHSQNIMASFETVEV